MLNVTVENIGELAVIECEGSRVQIAKSRDLTNRRPDCCTRTLRGACHRRRRSWHARVSAKMGARPQHPVPAVQSLQVSLERTETCQIDLRVLHPHDGRNDGLADIRQQPTRASRLSHKYRISWMKTDSYPIAHTQVYLMCTALLAELNANCCSLDRGTLTRRSGGAHRRIIEAAKKL